MEEIRGLLGWMWLHPIYAGILILFLVFIILLHNTLKNTSSKTNDLGPRENDEPDELTKITIYLNDGKIFEEHIAVTDSIEWDNENGVYVEFDTKEGKNMIFMTQGLIVKMDDP